MLAARVSRLSISALKQTVRANSTATTNTPAPVPEPKENGFIAFFPGNSIAAKTRNALIGTGIVGGLLASDVYVINEETLILASGLITARWLYTLLRQPVYDILQQMGIDRVNTVQKKVDKSKVALYERLQDLESYRNYADVQQAYYQLHREAILFEAQLKQDQERLQNALSIKHQLDERVRRFAERRDRERRALIEAMRVAVIESLKDPKVQEKILNQCVADLEQLPATKTTA